MPSASTSMVGTLALSVPSVRAPVSTATTSTVPISPCPDLTVLPRVSCDDRVPSAIYRKCDTRVLCLVPNLVVKEY